MVRTRIFPLLLQLLLLSGVAIGFQMPGGRASNVSFAQPTTRSPLFAPLAVSTTDNKLTDPSLPKWDPTNWTPKRLHNSPLFRSAAILSALALAGYTSKTPLVKISAKAGATVHLLSFATWFGTVVYTTFIAGITMFKNLERRTFGRLQSKLFPKYFNLCSISIVLQMISLQNLPSLGPRASTALGVALAMTLLNQFVLEPRSTKVMFKRYAMEDKDGRESDEYKKLASQFGKFHGMSSLANLIALCAAVGHGYHIASALVAVR